MGSKNKKGTRRDSYAKDGVNGSSNNGHGDKLITDTRFASVHSDPRFQNAPKHKSKVEIDSRFNRMFTDKSFSSSSTRIDKRGKPKKEKSQNPLKHYYRLDQEEDRNKKGNKKVEKEDVQSDDESKSESESEKLQKDGPRPSGFKLRSKRALSESESDDEDEDDDDVMESDTSLASTTDSDEDDEIYSEEEETLAQVIIILFILMQIQ